MTPRRLAEAVASAPRTVLDGEFSRHMGKNRRPLTGSDSGGRWGPPGVFPVLYLGRPRDSVTVEAYRHLVDPFTAEGMTADMVAPRRFVVCAVHVTEVLDLRSAEGMTAVGLTTSDLDSPVNQYHACQEVARVAHQLELHGVLAPAATGLGETLALFERHLPAAEMPELLREELWETLPADPRRLRLVARDSG